VFKLRLDDWYRKYGYLTKEKTHIIGLKRPQFTHKKLCGAYLSLKNNLPYLFTYKHYPDLNIQKTTNSLEGSFSHLKKFLRVHSGLTKERRFKLISEILRGKN